MVELLSNRQVLGGMWALGKRRRLGGGVGVVSLAWVVLLPAG